MEKEAQAQGRAEIVGMARAALVASSSLSSLEAEIGKIESRAKVPLSERKSLLLRAWCEAVDVLLSDNVLEEREEERLDQFAEYFQLPSDDIQKMAAQERVVKSAVLREVMDGKISQRITLTGTTLINFQKGETVLWAFADCKYLEDRTRKQFVGGSQGVSVRVAKGVYYRVGAFKGNSISYTERVHVDTGWMFVTSKNLYFAGTQKSVRIPYSKILSFEPFEDGIGIMRDAASAKLQIFATGDGWYTYNLVINLARM